MSTRFRDGRLSQTAQTLFQQPVRPARRLHRIARQIAVTLLFSVAVQWAHAQVSIVDENTRLPDYSGYYEGVDALDAGDYETAIREFTASAEAGLSVAQFNLGVMYFTGQGVKRDYQTALYWMTQAAEQGHVNAQFNLGTLYYNGLGMQPEWMSYWPLALINRGSNLREAERWYLEAAANDHGEAQYYLATMYESGYGVERDLVAAYVWARLAHDNEIGNATALQQSLRQRLTSQQLISADRRYAEWVIAHRQ